MKRFVWLAFVVVGLSACGVVPPAQEEVRPDAAAESSGQVRPVARPAGLKPPPSNARTAEQFDTTSADIEAGRADFESLEAYMLDKGEIAPNHSGRQEMLENLINRYL